MGGEEYEEIKTDYGLFEYSKTEFTGENKLMYW